MSMAYRKSLMTIGTGSRLNGTSATHFGVSLPVGRLGISSLIAPANESIWSSGREFGNPLIDDQRMAHADGAYQKCKRPHDVPRVCSADRRTAASAYFSKSAFSRS